jgi:uncharacterized membrane protein
MKKLINSREDNSTFASLSNTWRHTYLKEKISILGALALQSTIIHQTYFLAKEVYHALGY